MRASRRTIGAILLGAALLAGCQPTEPTTEPATVAASTPTPSAAPTPTAAPDPTPTPTPTLDPFAVPATIDTAYTERVLNELFRIDAGTLERALEAQTVTEEVRQRLGAVNMNEEAEIQSVALNAELATGLPNVKRPPGPAVISVERVLSSAAGCIAVVGVLNYSELLVDPGGSERRILVGLTADDSGAPLNPTHWKVFQTRVPDEQGELDLCA